jgi:hypothetical protein
VGTKNPRTGFPLLVELDVDEDLVELVEDTVDEVLVGELWVVEELEETVLDARRSRVSIDREGI